jgi:photosystem II stability/assembly factor-like uncharacterized protein
MLTIAALAAACAGAPATETRAPDPVLVPQTSGTTRLLTGISPVDDRVAWVSGASGTWARTTDGGETWKAGIVAGADTLQFRDIHAVDENTAWVLSIGDGAASRIYHTTDGGTTWKLQFVSREPSTFFDCFAFWDRRSAIAFSDSYDRAFPIITTEDGGATWRFVPSSRLPRANDGEGSFAASGTCVVARGEGTAWIGTGASTAGARVLRTTDRGRTWTVANTPIVRGSAAGIASLAFRDDLHGVALGGDIGRVDSRTDNVAITSDGGRTWTLGGRPPFTGAVYGSAYVPNTSPPALVGVGPRGLAYSLDDGMSWTAIDTLNHWSVGFASARAGWAVGPNGRITKIRLYGR